MSPDVTWPIVPRQTYSFNGAANTSSSMYLGPRNVATVGIGSGELLVRMSSATLPAGATVLFELVNVSISREDPSTVFVSSALCSALVNAADTQPELYTASFSGPGSMVAVRMTVAFGSTGGAATFTVAVDTQVRNRTLGFNRLDPSLGTCALWLSSLDGTSMYTDTTEATPSTNGAEVGRWKDRSGNTRHGDIVGAGVTLNTTGIHAHPAVAFDGASRLVTPSFSMAQPCTIYVVTGGGNAGNEMFDGTTVDTRVVYFTNTTTASMYAGSALNEAIAASTDPAVFGAVFNGASSVLRYNATETTGNPGTATSAAGATIGSGGGGVAFFTGNLGEVLVYLAGHDAGQRARVQAGLQADWGTP